MKWFKPTSLVLVILASISSTPADAQTEAAVGPSTGEHEDIFFHCGRFLQSCENNGTCDSSTGECTCDQDHNGYNCRNDVTDDTGNCDKKCQNGGTCNTHNGVSSCFCTSMFTGDLCETNRVSVKCSGLNIDITVLPMDSFKGKVYLGNNNSDETCFLTENKGTFSGEFLKTQDVCDGIYEDNSLGETFTKQMTIQYNPLFLDTTDLVLNLSCFHTANHTVENVAEVNVVKAEITKEADHKVSEDYNPAKLEILSSNMTDLTSEVNLGQLVNMFNFLEDDGVFKKLSVDSCIVADPDIQKSVAIIENKCPSTKAEKLFPEPASISNDPVGVKHLLKIFKLRESTTTLVFTCTVTMCKDVNDPKCAMNACDGNSRKRRGADDSMEASQKQETRATITIASDEDVHIITSENSVACADDPMVKTTLITLYVVSTILLLVCLVLVYCVMRFRCGRPSKQSEPVGQRYRMDNSP